MKTIKIGRGPNNDVVIKDEVVSTSHAIITVSDFGEVSIEDLNSKNGTFVNGEKITKAKLTSSSIVLLGNHSIDWKQIIQDSNKKNPKPQISIPNNVVDKKLIGRNAISQIRFSFDDVSDKHAYLCKQADGHVLIIDNNSTNGTYVNGSKITSPYTLQKGDNVSISNKHPLNWEAVFPAKHHLNTKLLISIAAAVVVIAGVFVFLTTREADWSEIYAEHKNDVVMIYVQSAYAVTAQNRPLSAYLKSDNLDYCYIDEDNDVSGGIQAQTGTGFFISKDGKLLTNRHVVSCSGDQKKNEETIRNAIQAALYQADLADLAALIEVNYVVLSVGIAQNDTYVSKLSDFIPCTIIKRSTEEDLDVALLQTNTKSLPNGSTFVDLSKAVASDKLSVGEKIGSIGFPKSFTLGLTSSGLEANNQSGEITQERGPYEYGHNITIHQGASGSPVYNQKGRFAGIIVAGFLSISQGYNIAIHPTPILEFVEKAY